MARKMYGNATGGLELLNSGGISAKRIYRKIQDKLFSINLDVINDGDRNR